MTIAIWSRNQTTTKIPTRSKKIDTIFEIKVLEQILFDVSDTQEQCTQTTDTSDTDDSSVEYRVIKSTRGKDVIVIGGYTYFQRSRFTWWCPQFRTLNCKAKLKLGKNNKISTFSNDHCHPVKDLEFDEDSHPVRKFFYATASEPSETEPTSSVSSIVNAPWSSAKPQTDEFIEQIFEFFRYFGLFFEHIQIAIQALSCRILSKLVTTRPFSDLTVCVYNFYDIKLNIVMVDELYTLSTNYIYYLYL